MHIVCPAPSIKDQSCDADSQEMKITSRDPKELVELVAIVLNLHWKFGYPSPFSQEPY